MKYILILIVLIVFLNAYTLDSLLVYKFNQEENVNNQGLENRKRQNDLIWNGGVRTNGGIENSIVMDPRIQDHYKTMIPIESLWTSFKKGGGFTISLQFTLETANNYGSEFCLFCLLNANKTLHSFDRCHDLDLGIIWKNRILTVITRNSEGGKCNHLELPSIVTDQVIGKPLNFTFRFDNGKRDIFHNGKQMAKYQPDAPQDVSTWNPFHHLWVGPIKTTTYKSSIRLFEYHLNAINRGTPQTYVSELLSKSISIQTPQKGILIRSPSRANQKTFDSSLDLLNVCELDDFACYQSKLLCIYDDCGICNGENKKCASKNGIQCYTGHTKSITIKDESTLANILATPYDVYIRSTNPSIKTFHGNYKCINNTIDSFWTPISQPSHQESVITNKISIGTLYQCITGKSRNYLTVANIKSELQSMTAKIQVQTPEFDVVCEFKITSIVNAIESISSQSDTILGGIFVNTFENTGMSLQIVPTLAYIRENDVLVSLKTCFNRYDALQNTSRDLQIIQKRFHTGADISIGNISQCIYNPITIECCYLWTLKTLNHYLLKKKNLHSELYLGSTINGIEYGSQFIFALNNVEFGSTIQMTPPPIPERITPLDPYETVICLYNDANHRFPYKKYSPHQTVYFKLQLVYKESIASGDFTCKKPRTCLIPELTLQLERFGMCIPTIEYQPKTDCSKLEGTLHKIIDNSDSMNPIYTQEWNPTIDDHTACSSIIAGSFKERLLNNHGFIEIKVDEIETPLVHPTSFQGTPQKTLNTFQTSFNARKTIISDEIGACEEGFVVDDSLNPGTCVTPLRRGFGRLWLTIRFIVGIIVMLAFFIILILSFHNHLHKQPHHHKKIIEHHFGTQTKPTVTGAVKNKDPSKPNILYVSIPTTEELLHRRLGFN